jgi:predicted small lipoprotein YifL
MLVAMIRNNVPHRGAFPGWHLFVWAVMLAMALTACGLSGPTQTSLSEEAAAKLSVSNSTQLASGGHDSEQTPEGAIPAIAWRRYGVDAPWDDVVAFFEAELSALGWEEGGGSSGLRSTIEFAVEAWHKGDRILRLGHLRDSPKPDSGSFATFYSVTLIGEGLPAN